MKKRRVRLGVLCGCFVIALYGLGWSYVSVITGSKTPNYKRRSSAAANTSAGQKNSKTAGKNGDTASNPNPSSGGPQASPGASTSPATIYPSGVLDLTNWKLTLPISASGDGGPQEILQPRLATFTLVPYFQLAAGGAVQFQAPVGGVTTSGSSYPRSELRQMTSGGAKEASWSNVGETHTMTIREAITHLPAVRPQLVAGQIHDANEYVILIRLEGSHLFVEADGDNVGTLDDAYKLGTQFTVKIVAGDSHIVVFYNGVQKADYAKSGSGYYFKAGCYTQSNPSKGDDPNDYGQVLIYDLQTD